MSYIDEIAAKITQLRSEQHSLQDIAISLKQDGYHIENVEAAFKQAGFQARVTRERFLCIPMVMLTVQDNTPLQRIREQATAAVTKLKTGSNTEELKQLGAMTAQKYDMHAVVNWADGKS